MNENKEVVLYTSYLVQKFHVDYNIELFAGMYFHPKEKDYPTILFFSTGSYTMMGGKLKKILKECEAFVKSLFTALIDAW